jgi:hypothetical protein
VNQRRENIYAVKGQTNEKRQQTKSEQLTERNQSEQTNQHTEIKLSKSGQ